LEVALREGGRGTKDGPFRGETLGKLGGEAISPVFWNPKAASGEKRMQTSGGSVSLERVKLISPWIDTLERHAAHAFGQVPCKAHEGRPCSTHAPSRAGETRERMKPKRGSATWEPSRAFGCEHGSASRLNP